MIPKEQLKLALNYLRNKCRDYKSSDFLQDLLILVIINQLYKEPEICCLFTNKCYLKLTIDPNYLEQYNNSKEDLRFFLNLRLFNYAQSLQILEGLLFSDIQLTSKKQVKLNTLLYFLNISLDYLRRIYLSLKALTPIQLIKKQQFLKAYSTISCSINIRSLILELRFNCLPKKLYKKLERFYRKKIFFNINNKIPTPSTEDKKIALQNPRNYYGKLWSSKVKDTGGRIWLGMMMQDNEIDKFALISITKEIIDKLNNLLYFKHNELFNPSTIDKKYLSPDVRYYPIFKRRGLTLKQCKEICTTFIRETDVTHLKKQHILVAKDVDNKFKFTEVDKNFDKTIQSSVPINENKDMRKLFRAHSIE